jgi:AmmeMemoRadiSam system protein B
MNAGIRQPVWAGQFYPEDAERLHRDVERFLSGAKAAGNVRPKAIIAPHAGYMYSGPIAGSAFAALRPEASEVRRVLLLGPSHRLDFQGLAWCSQDAFATPLGEIPLDRDLEQEIRGLAQVQVLDAAHAQEHCLEVELPFLQQVFANFALVPLVVGDSEDDAIAEVLERLWGGPETRIVVSSDLSHYLDYNSARELDRASARAIEGLRPGEIEEDQACGRRAIRGLLTVARRFGMRARTVDLRSSGDTAGRRDRVVGYGAFVFSAI